MSQTSLKPPSTPIPNATEKYARAIHNASLASVIIAPILALLPPRKLDLYTLALGALTVYSGNRLFRESYGRSFYERPVATNATPLSMFSRDTELPTDRAREFQRRYKADQEAIARAQGNEQTPLQKELAGRSFLEKAWYGQEPQQGWQAKREEEVQSKLAAGKGYGDIIMDQIWDVWSWGSKSDDATKNDSTDK